MNTEPATPAGSVTTRQRIAEVFRGHGFRRFFAARMVSQVGDGIFQIATADLVLFKGDPANPALRLFLVSAVTLIPFSAIGPFVGVFIDRWDRRKILTWVPLLRAFAAALTPLAAMAGTTSVPFLVVVLIVLSANRFFLATMSAVLPQLVPADDLLVGNSISSTGGSVANVVGLAIGTLLSQVFDGSQATVFASLAFILGALTAHRVPVHRGLHPRGGPVWREVREVAGQMVEGLRAVTMNPRVRYALSAIGVMQTLVGAMTGILITAFILDLNLEVASGFKLLVLLSVGIGIGVVLVPVVGRRIRHDLLIPISFVIAAAGVVVAIGPVRISKLTVGTLFLGLSYAFAKIPVDTIVQEEMADEIRGRAFAAYDVLFNVARVTGVGIAAALYARRMGTSAAIAAAGGAYLVTAVVFASWEAAMFKRHKRRAPVDLLVEGEMITVRAYAGSRADEEPRALVIGGTEIPVEQILWRAMLEEQDGRRGHAFVVLVQGKHVRIVRYVDEVGWLIESVRDAPETAEDQPKR